jgi:predicted regulator of Ras-like GTPase activity (Roadblock/LC7/MglB family)
MPHHILIVDANEAFAAMLNQGLEQMPDTRASVVSTGSAALQAVGAADYDLAIVDLLVRTLRQEHPDLRLIVIPLQGEDVPPDLAGVDLQGTLSKPFFLPELPARIRAALSQGAAGSAVQIAAPGLFVHTAETAELMSSLAQDLGAESVLLIQDGGLTGHTGRMPEEEVVALASVVCDAWSTSARVAQILGKEQLRFEQSIEGEEYLLYSLALGDDAILSIVIEGKKPLGMIRHRAKETAEAMRRIVGQWPRSSS